jgi:hypothetical protein
MSATVFSSLWPRLPAAGSGDDDEVLRVEQREVPAQVRLELSR